MSQSESAFMTHSMNQNVLYFIDLSALCFPDLNLYICHNVFRVNPFCFFWWKSVVKSSFTPFLVSPILTHPPFHPSFALGVLAPDRVLFQDSQYISTDFLNISLLRRPSHSWEKYFFCFIWFAIESLRLKWKFLTPAIGYNILHDR